QEEQVLQPSAPLQAEGMATEEFPGNADEADPAIEQGRGQMRAHAVAVFAFIKIDQLPKERRCKAGLEYGIAQVETAPKAEVILTGLESRLLQSRAADRLSQSQDLAAECLAKLLGAALFTWVRRQI